MTEQVVGAVSGDKKTEIVGSRPVIPVGQLVMSGKAGKPFSIDGQGFGNGEGDVSVAVSGRLVMTTRWNDHSIKGELPKDIKPGDVVVRTSEGKEIKGKFDG